MEYKNKFQDGQRVRVRHTGEEVTIGYWSYIPRKKRYSYTIIEHPYTLRLEEELELIEEETNNQ